MGDLNKQRIWVSTCDPAMDASFIDIKVLAAADTAKTVFKELLTEEFIDKGAMFYGRSSFGFYHPNLNIMQTISVPGETREGIALRINPGLDPHQNMMMISVLNKFADYNRMETEYETSCEELAEAEKSGTRPLKTIRTFFNSLLEENSPVHTLLESDVPELRQLSALDYNSMGVPEITQVISRIRKLLIKAEQLHSEKSTTSSLVLMLAGQRLSALDDFFDKNQPKDPIETFWESIKALS